MWCKRGEGLYELAKILNREDMVRQQIEALEDQIKTNSHPILKTKLKILRKELRILLG